jgi:hypothetical protein
MPRTGEANSTLPPFSGRPISLRTDHPLLTTRRNPAPPRVDELDWRML